MTSCKEEAMRWVHRTAAGGAAFAAIPVPLPTSAGLAAMETTMVAMIGEIYGDPMSGLTSAAASGTMSVLGQGLKWLAIQGTIFVPVLGVAIRMGIAAGAIETLGHAVVAHYERKYPGKMFEKREERDAKKGLDEKKNEEAKPAPLPEPEKEAAQEPEKGADPALPDPTPKPA